jgi:hypothetical protein
MMTMNGGSYGRLTAMAARAEIDARLGKASAIASKYGDSQIVSDKDFEEFNRLLAEIDGLEAKLAGLDAKLEDTGPEGAAPTTEDLPISAYRSGDTVMRSMRDASGAIFLETEPVSASRVMPMINKRSKYAPIVSRWCADSDHYRGGRPLGSGCLHPDHDRE